MQRGEESQRVFQEGDPARIDPETSSPDTRHICWSKTLVVAPPQASSQTHINTKF